MRRCSPKRELTPKALDALKAGVWRMPYLDRISILALSIIDKERGAAVNGLIEMVARMSAGCSADRRVMVAEALRNVADSLEHESVQQGIDSRSL